MFEDRTYENIMAECLANAPPKIDLRQGGIFFDAVASACLGLEKYYVDLRHAFNLCIVMSPECVGEYLDRKGWEYKVFRNSATPARYEYHWEGTNIPAAGKRFFAEELYFILKQNENRELYLEAEIPGILCNNILSGTPAVLMENLNLDVSQFGSLIEPGTDIEGEESYRERIREKIAGPAENGNRQHYKTWCESIDGVGRARIIPLFAGENTVMGVIIGADGLPAASTLLERVQEYIDPMTLGLTVEVNNQTIPVGDGCGDGAANIGAHFAAVAPLPFDIDVSFDIEIGAFSQKPNADAMYAEVKKAGFNAFVKFV
ncbi:MAG: baseplate J/gp47 family protein [Oscillospiraceae bacterium]|nr:baseplate J/gp47 family protein [Oscillospiraceae bacterium]